MLSKRPFRFVRVSVYRAVQCAWFTCMYLCRSVACFVHVFLSTSKMVCTCLRACIYVGLCKFCTCIYVGLCLVCACVYVGLCNEHAVCMYYLFRSVDDLCLFIKIYADYVYIYVGLCRFCERI
jgi:hypothetical protein